MKGVLLSIEIDYLRKKATRFRRLQVAGLAITLFGLVVMVVAHSLVPILTIFGAEPWERLETYGTWSMALGSLIAFGGLVLTIHYSRKLSEFVTHWSRVMEELERTARETGD